METNELLTMSPLGFGGSIIGLLLAVLFDPENSITSKHPLTNKDASSFLEEVEGKSNEERRSIVQSYLTDYWKRFFDKMEKPDENDLRELNESLKDINSEIKTLNDKRQDIIDEWIMK